MKGDTNCRHCFGTGIVHKIELIDHGTYTTRIHTKTRCNLNRRKLRKIRLNLNEKGD
jgi:hypothetical protein